MLNIPNWIPEVEGLWKIGGRYQKRQNRIYFINLIKTERRQRLFSCCLALRNLAREIYLETRGAASTAVALVIEASAAGLVVSVAAALVERINQSRLYGLFLPVEIDINWKTNSVTELATQFYNGNTTIAPILADELEEVGCDNQLWLRILRECPEVYHKGMTFIDNLLGK